MSTPAHRPGAPRFIAYSTLTREPVMVGHRAAELLADTRAVPALGYDNRFVEVLDCGPGGPDASTVDLRLDAARTVYRTVFRGSGALGQPGMPPFPLLDPVPPAPDEAAFAAIAQGLTALIARARAAHLDGLASRLDRALVEARDEMAEVRERPDQLRA